MRALLKLLDGPVGIVLLILAGAGGFSLWLHGREQDAVERDRLRREIDSLHVHHAADSAAFVRRDSLMADSVARARGRTQRALGLAAATEARNETLAVQIDRQLPDTLRPLFQRFRDSVAVMVVNFQAAVAAAQAETALERERGDSARAALTRLNGENARLIGRLAQVEARASPGLLRRVVLHPADYLVAGAIAAVATLAAH